MASAANLNPTRGSPPAPLRPQSDVVWPATPENAALRAVIARVETVITLPELTLRLLELLRDPDACAAQLGELIKNDPAITARILHVVNSPFYGLPGEVRSLERAVILIGLKGVKNIALAVSLAQTFRCDRSSQLRTVWRHSLAAAIAARRFGAHVGLPPDELFVGGLLHDLGVLLALQLFPTRVLRVFAAVDAQPLVVREQSEFGFDHEELGAALARRWGLPAEICACIASHHDPFASEPWARVAYAADQAALRASFGIGASAPDAAAESWDAEAFGLDPAVFAQVVADLPAHVQAVERSLS